MNLTEHNLNPCDGADKAWDAIHEWLDSYGLSISATDENLLHMEIDHMLKQVQVIESR